MNPTHIEADVASSRPLRKDAARNRAALVAAARHVFAERGLEASLDDVAHAAGVGVGTAYRHFANKYELAGAIMREGVDEMVGSPRSAPPPTSPWDGLVRFLESSCAKQTADRGLHEVLMGFHDEALAEEAGNRITPALTRIVDRAHESGDLRPDIDVTDVGVMILTLTTIAEFTASISADLWRRYLPIFLDALRSGSPLPVPPAAFDDMRRAFATYKQRGR